MPTVSIIVPVYNEEEYIEAALQSILNQDAPGVEVIVVNSQSTDRTVELASKYPVAILQAPRGKLKARAVGIENASGEIIVACDGDSIYPPGWLDKLIRHFDNPEVVAVSGPRIYQDALLINLFTLPYNAFCRPHHFMSGGNSAFKKHAFYQIGGFRPVDELNVEEITAEEETAFGDRLAQVGRYIYDFQAICYTSARRFFDPKHNTERQRGERF